VTRLRGSEPGEASIGLVDTSVFIATEQHRPVRGEPPGRIAVSVVTIGELRLGVLAAPNSGSRVRRLETLSRAEALDPLPIDREVAGAWAALRLALRDRERRMPLNDSWIAATAIAHGMTIVTQDDDYDDVPDLEVVRV
jgi:predicted nucleic acid-binding protein